MSRRTFASLFPRSSDAIRPSDPRPTGDTGTSRSYSRLRRRTMSSHPPVAPVSPSDPLLEPTTDAAAATVSSPSSARQFLRRGRTVLRSRRRSEQRNAGRQTTTSVDPTALAPRAGPLKRRSGSDAPKSRQLLLRKAAASTSTLPSHHRPHSAGFRNPWASAGRKGIAMRTRAAGTGSQSFFFHKVVRDRPHAEEVVAAMLLLADRPDFAAGEKAVTKDSRALATIWLGHCTFFLRARGLTVLTDPVWSARLGPLGPKRAVQPICEVEDLPEIDVVLISSANYDHFDKVAVASLAEKVSHWIVPLGLRALLTAAGVPEDRISESDWWQEVEFKGTKFVCTPSQHCSIRDDALWCSWVVVAPGHKFFYCGGTGYRALDKNIDDCESYEHRNTYGGPSCPAFTQISEKFGKFDTAFLPLGTYKPRSTMATVQGDPVDMLFVHTDLRVRRSIAHRWGTFASTGGESLLDPVRALESAIITSPVPEHEFTYLRHGKLHIT